MQDTWVWCLSWEDPMEKGMVAYSNILTWGIPWTEDSGGVQSLELQRVGHNWAINTFTLKYN